MDGTGDTLLRTTDRGLYCDRGGFYIDPWSAVDRAVVTHAHGDHASPGSSSYLAARAGERVLRTRLGLDAPIQSIQYGERIAMNGVQVSLHPAGHILGSSQVRVEHAGEVWVVSGDYKTEPDTTCAAFEPVACHTFITESTFGLPIYRWAPEREVVDDIAQWWRENAAAGRASVLFAYALGKAQRVLAGLGSGESHPGEIFTHGAVERINDDYRASGIVLPSTRHAISEAKSRDWGGALVVAPPLAMGTAWLRRFGSISTALVSGWMRIRGARRRRSVDRGFVLSDHADWPALLQAIAATGAQRVWATHGYREPLARWLRERGLDAASVATRWEGEQETAVIVPGETQENIAGDTPS